MLSTVSLHTYKSHTERHIQCGLHTAIVGHNGSGKSQILQAVHILAGGFRLVPRTPDMSRISCMYGDISLQKNFQICVQDGSIQAFLQSKKLTKPKYMDELPFRAVIFDPFDMNLPYATPSARRDYIDDVLSRAYMSFGPVHRDYTHIMRQRNTLLKQIQKWESVPADLDFWDNKFSHIVETYMQYRFRYVDFVLSHIHIVQHLLPQYVLQFAYTTSLPRTDIAGYVTDYLLKNRQRDILVGHTSIGPHRDDYVCSVDTSVHSMSVHNLSIHSMQVADSRNEISSEDIPAEYMPVADYLSRGENKTILLGLKHIEILFLEKTVGKPLILLFDDIFSELDQVHSVGILDMFDTYQYIITAQSLPLYIQNTHKITCINIDSEYSI